MSSIASPARGGRTTRETSDGAKPPSMSIDTSSVRLLRRYWSIAALRAISKIHGRKLMSESVSRSRRSADMNASCVTSSARPPSRT